MDARDEPTTANGGEDRPAWWLGNDEVRPAGWVDDPEYAANDGEGVEADMASHFAEASRWFGYNLKFVREKREESQTALAKKMVDLGFAWYQTTVSRVEAGERPVQLGEALAVATILETDIGTMIQRPSTVRLQRLLINANRQVADHLNAIEAAARGVILARVELEAQVAAARAAGFKERSIEIAEDWLSREPEDAVRKGREAAEQLLNAIVWDSASEASSGEHQ